MKEQIREILDQVSRGYPVEMGLEKILHFIDKDRDPKKKTIYERKIEFGKGLEQYSEKYGRPLLQEFYLYWTEHGPKDKKMRYEKQTSFDTGRRLARWSKNNTRSTANKINEEAHVK